MRTFYEAGASFDVASIGEFRLVPVVVGGATPGEMATLLAEVWGGDETLLAVLRELALPDGVRAAPPDEVATRVSNLSRAYRVNLNVIALDTDENGLVPVSLEEKLHGSRPRFLYLIPSFHNPSGRTLPQERRDQLAIDQAVLLPQRGGVRVGEHGEAFRGDLARMAAVERAYVGDAETRQHARERVAAAPGRRSVTTGWW